MFYHFDKMSAWLRVFLKIVYFGNFKNGECLRLDWKSWVRSFQTVFVDKN